MDSVSKAIPDTIGSAGFTVQVSDTTVTAIDQKTSERFIVRFDELFHQGSFYDAVVELAQQVGIDLEDG